MEKSFIAHPWIQRSVVGLEEYSAHDWRAATSGTARSSYLARVGPVTETVQHASSYSGGKLFALVASLDVILRSNTRVTMIHLEAWKGFGRSELARRCLNNIWRKLFQKYFLVGIFVFFYNFDANFTEVLSKSPSSWQKQQFVHKITSCRKCDKPSVISVTYDAFQRRIFPEPDLNVLKQKIVSCLPC